MAKTNAKQVSITDGELPIMKVLWEKGPTTSPEIYNNLEGAVMKNKSTFKTELLRLVQKGAVKAEELKARNFLYSALVSRDEYIAHTRKNLLNRVFDGSTFNMLLNFVREEKISKAEIEKLLDQIKEE